MPLMFINRARTNIGKKGLAAIIYVHGGGGNSGDALADMPLMSTLSTANDLVVISMNYALAPLAKMPAQCKDVVKVIEYVKNNAEKLGIDKQKISLYG